MIPKDWSGITVQQFIELYPTFKVEELNDMEIINNKIKQLSIIKGISLQDAENCTVVEGNKVKLLLETPLPEKIYKMFKLNGVVYRFNINANELNTSGYIGVMNAIKDDPIKNMHVSIFNLSTPIKRTLTGWKAYDLKPSEVGERLEEFKQLPVSVAYPIGLFFLKLSKSLTPVTEAYLKRSLKEMESSLKEIKEDLLDTDGQ